MLWFELPTKTTHSLILKLFGFPLNIWITKSFIWPKDTSAAAFRTMWQPQALQQSKRILFWDVDKFKGASGCTNLRHHRLSFSTETAHIFEIRDLRLELANQHLGDSLILTKCQSFGAQLHSAFVSIWWVVLRGKCLLSSLLSDFILSIQCCQSVFSDYVHAQTPKRASGLAKPRSAPSIITDFPLLLHPCLPNSTSYDLNSSGLSGSPSGLVNSVKKIQNSKTTTKFASI